MGNEAEAAKEEDQKRKAIIDLKNEADSLIYNTEKQLYEHSARIPDSVKDQVRNDISSLNEAIVAESEDQIRDGVERLKNSSMEIGKAIYSQSASDEGSQEQEPEPE